MISADQLRDRLQAVPLFARCHPSDLQIVAQRSSIRSVDVGTELVRAGTEGDEFFVLLEGTAEVRRNGEIGGTLEAGDHFGELALLDPAPRSADVVMTSDGVVSVLTRTNFKLVLEAVPGVAPELMAFLARRLRVADAPEPNEEL